MAWVHTGIVLGTLVLTIVAVPAFVIAVFRARAGRSATPIVRIALIGATVFAAFSLLRTLIVSALWFAPNSYPFFAVRVQDFWPLAIPTWDTQDDTTPRLVTGGFESATVSAAGLDVGTRVLLSAGDLVAGFVATALAALVAFACWRLAQERPFGREIARLSLLAAVICFAGGFGSQVLLQLGGMQATAQILDASPGGAGELIPATGVTFDFWPLFAAIGLGAFSALMRYGVRLEHETAGLV